MRLSPKYFGKSEIVKLSGKKEIWRRSAQFGPALAQIASCSRRFGAYSRLCPPCAPGGGLGRRRSIWPMAMNNLADPFSFAR
jgi:hypothetical protein